MKRITLQIITFSLALLMLINATGLVAFASETEDEAVSAVIAQLEAIDSLQEMQNKRSKCATASEYEEYVSKMFAARLAAQTAYDALSDAQKSQIDAALVAKLDNELSNIFYAPTVAVTPRTDEYQYEVIFKNRIVYEIGHHVSGEMPTTIILVDTAKTGSSWTPDGLYEYGKSNYEVTYCCEAVAPVNGGTHYKRLNLEDSGYYGISAAEHIRAIVQSSYPYLTLYEMKAKLKAGGLDSSFVDSLTRGDIISAVQLAIWAYSNGGANGTSEYVGTIEMTNNSVFKNPVHDYTNELWSWWNTSFSTGGIYDAEAAYRVNTLVYYLCNLPGVPADDDQLVISDVKITRAELITGSNDTYSVGLYIYLNAGGSDNDNLTLTVTSYSENADGTTTVTGRTRQTISEAMEYGLFVNAKYGDTISVVVEGTQHLAKGVYFYEPEGGMTASQCLVGMAEGETPVRVEETFQFDTDIEKGLRIYKTDISTGLPLSDITFTVYKAVPGEGESLSSIPTDEEIAKYAIAENLVGAVSTDATGYASITLDDGTYLVIEEHNTDKVKAPIDPFYINIPMQQEKTTEGENGTVTEIEYINVVSIYPKNEIVETPEIPPELPPIPDNVTGRFSILKYDEIDESILLEGAQFQVYRPATEEDTDTTIITCDGIEYAVVPVMVNGATLILTTGEDGTASTPELTCGTYFIKEIKAPAGYNLREDAISVTVTSSVTGEVKTVQISNQRGNILPETGGVGTTWFLLIGGAMVITAAVLMVTKKRMIAYE